MADTALFLHKQKRRFEAVLMNVIQDAYAKGVFTRKIDTLKKVWA
jgi:transposase-like protein